jgi:hypothetical protein
LNDVSVFDPCKLWASIHRRCTSGDVAAFVIIIDDFLFNNIIDAFLIGVFGVHGSFVNELGQACAVDLERVPLPYFFRIRLLSSICALVIFQF